MLLIILLFGIGVYSSDNNGTKIFTASDMHQLYEMGSPEISSDGKKIAYMLRKWNEDDDTRYYQIDVLDVTTEKITNLVALSKNAVSNAILSPDGAICAYFSGGQIWTVPTSGNGESTQLTNFPDDLELQSMKWSPEGNYILVSIQVYEDCKNDLSCTSKKVQEREAYGSNTFYIYTKTFVRHWSSYKIENYDAHLHILPLTKTSKGYKVAGDPIDIMPDLDCESPIPPFGGSEEYDIRSDDTLIAFNCKLQSQDAAWTTDWKIYYVSVAPGSYDIGAPIMISHTNARTQDPSFTPDGKSIIYSSMTIPGQESDRLYLVVHDISSGTETLPGYGWQWSVAGPKIVKSCGSSEYIIFSTDYGQNNQIMAMESETGNVQTLVGNGMNSNIFLVGDVLYYSKNTVYFPTELFTTPLTCDGNTLKVGGDEVEMTGYNNEVLSQFDLPEMTEFSFQSEDQKFEVFGLMIKPPNFDSSKKYPVAHLIHGGPEGIWDNSWSTRWNPQLWAANGFVTVMINPRGSVGFGQNFTSAVWQDWGGMPYKDLMDGIDYLVGKYSYLDESKLTACGASYGGFMINWINTQNTRYSALVCHDGVFDSESFYYSTDEIWFPEQEFGGGTPEFAGDSGYAKFNPRRYCDQMTTPQLTFHGGIDFRIPIAQGVGVFTCLQRRGIDSKLILMPEESHFVLREKNSIMWYANVMDWLNSHV